MSSDGKPIPGSEEVYEYDEFSRRPSVDPAPAGFTGLVVGAMVVLGALIAFLMFRVDEEGVKAKQSAIQRTAMQVVQSSRYYESGGVRFVRMRSPGSSIIGATLAEVKAAWESTHTGTYLFACSYALSTELDCFVASEAKQ